MEYSNNKESLGFSPDYNSSDANYSYYQLKNVDNLLDESEFLRTVDNLLEYGSFVSVKSEYNNSTKKSDNSVIFENETSDSYEDEEVPTVSGIFSAHNEEVPVSSGEASDIFKFTEEDIQNENSLYTVDNLFGLEENDYSIMSVDNLFYEEETCLENVPENQGECKQLVGSLLHRIIEYYE